MIKQNKKGLVLVVAMVLMVVLLASCGGGGGAAGGGSPAAPPAGGGSAPGGSPAAPPSGGGAAPATIKIGIPNPATGPLASFGIGTPWAEKLVVDFVNKDGGIYIKDYDKKIPIEIFTPDTESSDVKAGEVAKQLVTNNGVNMLIARHTPATALPVSQAAETLQVPFVSLECPVDPWLAGGPYQWGFHAFWTVNEVCDMYMAMWKQLGYGEGTVVGGIFPNDPDGIAWKPIFEKKLPENGFKLVSVTPEMDNQEWTNAINQFKSAGVKIVTGVPITPLFASFAQQCVQQGFNFDIATCGRAFLFPSDAEAMPKEIIPKLSCEVWWSPWHPWKSALTGTTCPELADAYTKETGQPWSAPMGYKYAGVEIAVDALTRAQSLDPKTIVDAIGATDLDTMVGHIKYDPTTRVAPTMIVGGQWTVVDDPAAKNGYRAEIKIVYNANHPEIPLNGTLQIPK